VVDTQPSSSSSTTTMLALATAATAGALVGATMAVRTMKEDTPAFGDDDAWFRLAWSAVKARTRKPRQSNFRVLAVVVYSLEQRRSGRGTLLQSLGGMLSSSASTSPGNDDVRFLIGHNDEACALPNGFCAERAAFMKMTMLLTNIESAARVRAVYLVSDAQDPITPGVLCREFMSSSPFVSMETTRIVMEGAGGKESRRESTLAQLWPLASPYTRLSSVEQLAEGQRLARLVRERESAGQGMIGGGGLKQPSSALSSPLADGHKARKWNGAPSGPLDRVRRAATDAASRDIRDDLHPVRMGAAVIFEDGSVSATWQRKALEYGCSLDPVCQLAKVLEEHGIRSSPLPGLVPSENQHQIQNQNDGVGSGGGDDDGILLRSGGGRSAPAALCMCDQWGVCHAPFGFGRSYLVENGWGGVPILCHDREGNLHTPTAEELVPGVPLIGNLTGS
jgi:cytidine deaminase